MIVGPFEWLTILLIIVIVFLAPWKIPQFIRSVGEFIKEFRKVRRESSEEISLSEIAKKLGIETEGKSASEIAKEIEKALEKRGK